eukprot:TRINITY_DN14992_c0_g1_i1.p2 TRINITY_DN14992_c0_g1~~TRINITY_DN14992_c0_g1_i1.p2  ORF type:complete len:175 (+),score=10.64 TRINITY_DN14992_c0_g1_i1:327-851(+)
MRSDQHNPLLKVNCMRSFSHNGLVFSITSPLNNPNLLIIGGRNGLIKYYDLKQDMIVFEQQVQSQYISDIILLERALKPLDNLENTQQFSFIMSGTKQLYYVQQNGKVLDVLFPLNAEDFFGSQVLTNRNMLFLGMRPEEDRVLIRFAITSQFSSQHYQFSSNRVTIAELFLQV